MIGFTEEIYTVSEGVGMFTDITVGLIEGGLGLEVVITVSTQTDTAKGKFILCLDLGSTYMISLCSNIYFVQLSSYT